MSSFASKDIPQSHIFPYCMAFLGTPDGINLAFPRILPVTKQIKTVGNDYSERVGP